jgi:hypothetical protein
MAIIFEADGGKEAERQGRGFRVGRGRGRGPAGGEIFIDNMLEDGLKECWTNDFRFLRP